MKRFFFACLLLISVQGSGQAPVIAPEKLQQDHQVLVTSLEELHPGIYRYQTREQFSKQEEQIRKQLNRPMTAEAFYRLEMPLIAALHCGHTKWHKKDQPDDRYPFRQDNLFPLQLYFRDSRAFVIRSFSETDTVRAGTEILSINGKKIVQIMQELKKHITIDGNVESALYSELNQSFNGYYASFIENPADYSIEYRAGAKKGSMLLSKVSLQQLREVMNRNKPLARPSMELSMPVTGVAMLRIDRFYPGEGDPDFYKFIDSAFLVIKRNTIASLIIDLRNNEGGVEEYGGYLYSYLSKGPFSYYRKIRVARNTETSVKQYAGFPPGYQQALPLIQEKDGEYLWPMQEYLAEKTAKENAFGGKVIVLTNGFSFSVTSEFAAVAKTYGRALFIGEETGGAYEGDNSGVFAIVALPNSGLAVSIPLMAFYMNTKAGNPRARGILPDIKVVATVEDVISGRDLVLKKALAEATK